MHRYKIDSESIYGDAFRGDTIRRELLVTLGWKPDHELPYVLNCTAIEPMMVPTRPDGYAFQSGQGIEDAAALADVHNAAFGSIWTPEFYRKVITSPGYAPERELVIQAPDGTYVAFCVTWYDHLNHTGLFEPVGTHKDHSRRGFGRAILVYGMQQMAAAGMDFATVANFGNNEADRLLPVAWWFILLYGFAPPFLLLALFSGMLNIVGEDLYYRGALIPKLHGLFT